MVKLHRLRRDAEAEEKGRWFVYHEDFAVLIRFAGTQPVRDAFRRHQVEDYVNASAGNEDDDGTELANRLKAAVAESVLLDWRNLEDEDGNPKPHSQEAALELFNDPDCGDLWRFVVQKSQTRAEFRRLDLGKPRASSAATFDSGSPSSGSVEKTKTS